MSRHHDRQRSRDRHGYRGRSQSSDSYEKKKRTPHRHHHQTNSQPLQRRVKFNDVADIKVFRKEDEPNSKGLTEADLQEYMKKIESEKGANSFNNMNWEKMKHMDAQLQNNSIKEQKQKEKILNEKLQTVREELQFYIPLALKKINLIAMGQESLQREALASRINDVLGCFYTPQSIPSEPTFQIQNKSTALQPKLINFDKQRIDNKDLSNISKKLQKKDQKPLKGILKKTPEERMRERTQSEPRRISPALINLLRQIQINKAAYPKDRAQMLLRPYKQSGELDYLKNNPSILQNLMRSSSVPVELPKSSTSPSRAILPDAYKIRYSVSPQSDKPSMMSNPQAYPGQPLQNDPNSLAGQSAIYNNQFRPSQFGNYMQYGNQYPNYQGQVQQGQQQANYNPAYGQPQDFNTSSQIPIQNQGGNYPNYQQQSTNAVYGAGGNRNYKTVPCKYYHSPQGCVKANNCTFIHDQEYAGKPTPSMMKSNRGMVMTSYGSSEAGGAGGNFYPPFQSGPYEGQN